MSLRTSSSLTALPATITSLALRASNPLPDIYIFLLSTAVAFSAVAVIFSSSTETSVSPLTVTSLVTSLYPSLLTTTVYVPFATLAVVTADSEAAAVASALTAVPLTTLTEAPETLVVTVIAPSLKVGILSLSTIAQNQCLWVCMRCGVTF